MTGNPYTSRKDKNIGASGRSSEDRTNKRMGGRQTPASGAMVGAKGDIQLGDILLEAKSTTATSMTVALNWLLKIAGEASRVGKVPALSVTFVTANGTPRQDGAWVMIPERVFMEMEAHGLLTLREKELEL